MPLDPRGAALDAGERAVIAVAMALKANSVECLLIMDDRKAREVASAASLSVLGAVGVLLRAKAAGHIKAVGPLLAELIQRGYFLSVQLVSSALVQAGEA